MHRTFIIQVLQHALIRYTAPSVLIVGLYICGWLARTPHKISIIISPEISSLITPQIQNVLLTEQLYSKRSLVAALHKVQSFCSTAQSITVTQYRAGHAQIEIKHEAACARLNNHQLLLLSGRIVPEQEYDHVYVTQLPYIEVTAREPLDLQEQFHCAGWISQKGSSFLQQYTLKWHTQTYIELIPHTQQKSTSGVRYLASHETLFTPQLCAAMEEIIPLCETKYRLLCQTQKRKFAYWLVDLRVTPYCIVSPTFQGPL